MTKSCFCGECPPCLAKQARNQLKPAGFDFKLNNDGVFEITKHNKFYCFAQSMKGVSVFAESIGGGS